MVSAIKNACLQPSSGFSYEASGFEPLVSFAAGGLAEAWTGGAYALNDQELGEYPFDYGDIEPHYSEVAWRIGLIGAKDDMTDFSPITAI